MESVLAENKNAIRTGTGLIYEIVKPGNNVRSQNSEDVFVMDWKMLNRDETVVLTLNEPEGEIMRREFTLENMMPGMAEGIQLIGEGGQIKLYIPSTLIYKPSQTDLPQVTKEIIFLVDLLEIKSPGNK
ncbi:MAG: hypothetical protein LUH15_16630 [Tannerellaceae bacterium]|nr:hypothetical protein [Tannerellaceae bacterium]